MSANGVNTEIFDTIIGGDKVMSVTLKALDELSVTRLVGRLPTRERDSITVGIESWECSAATSTGGWIEVIEERTTQRADSSGKRAQKD